MGFCFGSSTFPFLTLESESFVLTKVGIFRISWLESFCRGLTYEQNVLGWKPGPLDFSLGIILRGILFSSIFPLKLWYEELVCFLGSTEDIWSRFATPFVAWRWINYLTFPFLLLCVHQVQLSFLSMRKTVQHQKLLDLLGGCIHYYVCVILERCS